MYYWKMVGGSFAVAIAGLTLGLIYGGPTDLAVVAILAVLEVSLSFDNATMLARMSPFWQ